MNRQYGIVAGEPHTYLEPELVHLMTQLHEAAQENISIRNSFKKEDDEKAALAAFRAKQKKELDPRIKVSAEQIKHFQELIPDFNEQNKQEKLSNERCKPNNEKVCQASYNTDT
jgi:hypothetical protein